MVKKNVHPEIEKEEKFLDEINSKERRKIRAQSKKNRAIWMGLGLFGVIGWSVVVPTIIGVVIGLWLDRKSTGQISWTLTFLFLGIVLGCWNAWHWVQKEYKLIEKEREEE